MGVTDITSIADGWPLGAKSDRTHEIVAAELTPDDVGDVSAVPELLDQIEAEVASLTADGAYDGAAVYDAVADRHPRAAVIVPPRTTAVPSETTTTQRELHPVFLDTDLSDGSRVW